MSGQGVCSHCGGPVPPGGRFCENCGRPLAGAPSASPALPPIAAGIGGPPGLPPPAFAARPRRRAGLWVATVAALAAVAAVVVLFLLPGSASPGNASERTAASIQRACDAKDSQAATALLHPAVRASYGKTLKDHEAELPRLGKLLATRKLLIANADVAEYEVTEDGETFIVTFERHGDQWLLVGM